MWIWAVVGVVRELERARVEAVHRRGGITLRPLPRGLHVADVEHTALVVNVAAWPVNDVVGGVMRVGGVEAVEQALLHVCLVVSVGVLEVNQVRTTGDDDASVPELEAGRVVHARECDHLVGHAVAILVRQNDERILHLLVGAVLDRLPLGIVGPDGSPEAALGIDTHLHRVDHVVEHFLGGEDIGFHVRPELELGQRLLRLVVFYGTLLVGIAAF